MRKILLNDKKDLMALFMHIVHEGAQLTNTSHRYDRNTTDARLKKRIVRTVIHEVIADS